MEYYNAISTEKASMYKRAAAVAGVALIGATTAAYIKGKSVAPQDTFVKQIGKGYESAWDKAKAVATKPFNKSKNQINTNKTITQTTTTTNQISFTTANGKTEVAVNGQKVTDQKEIDKYLKMNKALNDLGDDVNDISSTITEGTQRKIIVNGKEITDEKEIEKYSKIVDQAMKKAGLE